VARRLLPGHPNPQVEAATMATKRNKRAFEYAKELILEGRVVLDDRDAWSEHEPTAEQENEFIRRKGIQEYARWHLGIDEDASAETKAAYKFPYGDFEKVHRCAVISAESRAGQYKYHDIEDAAAHLHGMMQV
jgi:hypothetical protein